MNVYVAGKTSDTLTVRTVQKLVRATGHKLTYDWTKIIEERGGDVNEVDISEEDRVKYAVADAHGVYECNILIAIGHPHLSGTIWECGMAAAWGKRIWLVRWELYGRVSIFEDLPNVERVEIQTLSDRLWAISSKRLEMEPAPRWRLTGDGLVPDV